MVPSPACSKDSLVLTVLFWGQNGSTGGWHFVWGPAEEPLLTPAPKGCGLQPEDGKVLGDHVLDECEGLEKGLLTSYDSYRSLQLLPATADMLGKARRMASGFLVLIHLTQHKVFCSSIHSPRPWSRPRPKAHAFHFSEPVQPGQSRRSKQSH